MAVCLNESSSTKRQMLKKKKGLCNQTLFASSSLAESTFPLQAHAVSLSERSMWCWRGQRVCSRDQDHMWTPQKCLQSLFVQLSIVRSSVVSLWERKFYSLHENNKNNVKRGKFRAGFKRKRWQQSYVDRSACRMS